MTDIDIRKVQQQADNLQIPLYVRNGKVVQRPPEDDKAGWQVIPPDPKAAPSKNHGGERVKSE